MSQIISHINPQNPEFRANYEHNQSLVSQLRERQQMAASERPPRVIQRQRDRGKLLVRERIEAILDHGSPFLELPVTPFRRIAVLLSRSYQFQCLLSSSSS